ncbi:MAG: hypothetical protein CMJ78_13375 [Planctomycetaceae bacterium]|nr:hypothetical protein [Planctomycetaceae bacterium]
MVHNVDKAESRGVSADMSPEAISRRLDIVSELYDLCITLGRARYVGKVEESPKDKDAQLPPQS